MGKSGWVKAGEMNGIQERHSNYPAFCEGTGEGSWIAERSAEE